MRIDRSYLEKRTSSKLSFSVGLGLKPMTVFLNASAGFVFTYGTPGSVVAMYALIDLYRFAGWMRLVSLSAASSLSYSGLLAGSPNWTFERRMPRKLSG